MTDARAKELAEKLMNNPTPTSIIGATRLFHVNVSTEELNLIVSRLLSPQEDVERLRVENARLTEHCSTVPERPDDIGRMIQCHFDNLKSAKVASDKHAIKAMSDRERQSALIAELVKALEAGVRCAKLAMFVIRKQGVMPNASWETGFNSDLKVAEEALAAVKKQEVK